MHLWEYLVFILNEWVNDSSFGERNLQIFAKVNREDDGLIKWLEICSWWLLYNDLYETKLCTTERNV